MALNFFRQRDIDEMDASHIPDSFFDYFESLSQERKDEIINSRPDLAAPLGYTVSKAEQEIVDEMTAGTEENDQAIEDIDAFEAVADDYTAEDGEDEEDIFAQIRVNRYENEDLDKFFVDGARPLEVLTIPDNTEKCIVHRCDFEKKNIKYKSTQGSTLGLVLNLCRECKRVYLEESKMEYMHQKLMDRHIPHTFYDVGLTNLYLRSQQPAYELGEDEKIYVPDVWVEENPTCPVHDLALFELSCEKSYSGRKVSFTGYFCDRCNKVLVRKAYISDLLDECAKNGIPEIDAEPLVKQVPQKKPMPKKEIRPDYFIQDGKRQQYNYLYNVDCFKLTEEDTVVISDSIYCNLDGHDTKEVLAMIMVQQRPSGRKAYLFMVGYCAECQKYYMDENDYKAVYSKGRPEVTILNDLDKGDYFITSGEVFNLERTHLKKFEDNIANKIDDIHQQQSFTGKYTTGQYDDGALHFAKNHTIINYESRLDELKSYQPKPYEYRVDITADGQTETYYFGNIDIDLDGERKVLFKNSDFGQKMINYRTSQVTKDGKEYNVKLVREYDIQNATLYGYENTKTDEDIIFRSGVTDPFLVRVLRTRKKQHALIDIIVTIQENQNKIVDAAFDKNIIVQGCAGSGKTMVLLHRLSSLNYNNRHFDFGKHALILTPNEQFNMHIKGVADGLQIGSIDRESVEEYYINMLMKYSSEFKPDTKLVSERSVHQGFVDYIYSDHFTADFEEAYEKVISKRNQLAEILDNLTKAMGQPSCVINFEDDSRVIEQIRLGAQTADQIVKNKTSIVLQARESLEKIMSRKGFLEERIPESEKFAANIVKEALPRVYTKIATYISSQQNEIDQLKAEQGNKIAEQQKVRRTILKFGKKAKLEQLDKDLKSIERKLNSKTKRQEEENLVLSISQEGKTNDEILDWMRQVMLLVKEVQDEVRLCRNSKAELEKYQEELRTIDDDILKAQQKLTDVTENGYSEEVTEAIQYLYQKVEEYSLLGTFKMIFDEAVSEFKGEHNIKNIMGKYHRYDLYAELLFAKKYYKKVYGTTQFLCVDEAQDLALNEYRLIAELNQNNVVFNLFGDTNQLMKPNRGISDWSALKQLYGAEEYVLNENYRNTNQITRFCNSSFGMNVLQTGVDGVKVREIARKDLEPELAELKLSTERIAILIPRGVRRNRYLLKEVLPEHISDILGDKIGNGLISVLYVDEAKGIEFDKVYVVANTMARNERYIAYTRALSELIIVVDESLDKQVEDASSRKQKRKLKELKRKTSHSYGTLKWDDQNPEVIVKDELFEVSEEEKVLVEDKSDYSAKEESDNNIDLEIKRETKELVDLNVLVEKEVVIASASALTDGYLTLRN